jgi:hypothetical protein
VQAELILREEANGLGRGGQRAGDDAGVGLRLQPGEPRRTRRRQREAADGLHNAIEFEGPQGSGMHQGVIKE